MSTATAERRADFSLLAEGELKWYTASKEARRGFCGRCGSTLFWDGVGRDYISIAAGSLDDSRPRTATELSAMRTLRATQRRAPPWYDGGGPAREVLAQP